MISRSFVFSCTIFLFIYWSDSEILKKVSDQYLKIDCVKLTNCNHIDPQRHFSDMYIIDLRKQYGIIQWWYITVQLEQPKNETESF